MGSVLPTVLPTVLPRVLAASIAGTSHLRRGLPCQDAIAWKPLGDQALVAVLADGAGSAQWAELGATTTVATAIAALTTAPEELNPPKLNPPDPSADQGVADAATNPVNLVNPADPAAWLVAPETWDDRLKTALGQARAALTAIAQTKEGSLRDLACTAIALVATPQAVTVVQVGDGAVVVADRQAKLTALTRPPVAEYANVTSFLTDEDWAETCQITTWTGDLAGLVMFSDGLQRIALELPAGEPFEPFFRPLLGFVAACDDLASGETDLKAFLRSPRLSDRTDDDLSLLLAAWPET